MSSRAKNLASEGSAERGSAAAGDEAAILEYNVELQHKYNYK